MAAGLGFKTFTTGEVLTAGDVNGYLMQGINVFTNATARDAAITAPAEGQFAFTKDNNSLWYYDGAAWVASGATGDIEGVTAGVGISGGGTSGTVTVTNSMATAITTAGDVIYGTGSGTFSRLGIGTANQVLTVNSGATAPEWKTPAGGSTFSGCAVYTSTQFSISSNTVTTLNWDSELYDTDSYHSTVTNTDRLTIPAGKSGYYNFYGAARIDNSSANTGFKFITFQKNGSTFSPNLVVNGNNASTSSFYSTFNQTVYLAAADYITMRAYSESQSATINEATTFFQITYLGA
jgi:hypothetical protein